AALDDQVLPPAGDEQFALGQVAEIARVQPAVLEDGPGRLRITKVSRRDGGATDLHASHDPLAQRPALGIDDPNLVLRKRATARDEAQRVRVIVGRRPRLAGALERIPGNTLHPWAAREGRHG